MTSQEMNKFIGLIAAMARTFNAVADDALYEGYWIGLNDMPFESVRAAVNRAVRENDRLPTVKQLREFCGVVSLDDEALAGWMDASRAASKVGGWKSVDFEDGRINATIRHLGGWERLCQLTEREEPFYKREFLATFKTLSRINAGGECASPLGGLIDAENARLVDDEQEPVAIGSSLPSEARKRLSRKQDRKAIANDAVMIAADAMRIED